MPTPDARLLRLESRISPQARVIVVDWFETCEPREAAIKRAGKVNPNDVLIVCSTWLRCTRRGKHRHDDAQVVVHAKR